MPCPVCTKDHPPNARCNPADAAALLERVRETNKGLERLAGVIRDMPNNTERNGEC